MKNEVKIKPQSQNTTIASIYMSISKIYHITTTYVATPRSIEGVLYGSAIFILLLTIHHTVFTNFPPDFASLRLCLIFHSYLFVCVIQYNLRDFHQNGKGD